MKKLFKLMLAACVLFGAASCGPLGGNNGGGSASSDFTINVSNITATNATVSVTPSNDNTYYFDIVEQSTVNSFSSLSAFATAYVEFLQEQAAEYGYNFADFLSSGNDSYTFSNTLIADTDYYAFAVGVNANGTITTDVTVKAFTTLSSGSDSGATSQNTFAISVSGVTSNSATISVNPSNRDTYYFDVYPKDVADQYGGMTALAADYVAYIKELYESYGYTFADALSSGPDSFTFDGNLDPGTTYYAFAFGVNADGTVTTDVTTKTFTTEASDSTGGSLDLSNLTDGGYMNYGDYYEVGATNWYIELYTADYSEMVVLEVQTSTSATSCVGTYPFNTTFAAGSAISGFIYEQYIYGSYWAKLSASTDDLEGYALINNGSLSISKSDTNYVIALDATTDDGSAITASYNGELIDYSTISSVMSTTPKRKSFRLPNLDSFKKLGGKNIMLKPISKKLVSTPAEAPIKLTTMKHANIEAKAPKFTMNKAFTK